MASRAQQKEAARQRRLEEERARQEAAARMRRTMTLVGIVLTAIIVVGVAVVIFSSSSSKSGPNPTSAAGKQQATVVANLLGGIPQSGLTLGSSSAKVTVTEYGDLECPVCRDFALGAQQQLIKNDVRSGKVNMTYKSLCTATCNGPNAAVFPTQQAAAIAAGQQNHAWDYIELFYHQQGSENTSYVTDNYLNALAREISGLNFGQWSSARQQNTLAAQVTADQQAASAAGYNSTPTIVVKGPKGQAQPIVGDTTYSSLESAIKSVQ
jgi:protein-disulfide isomerase